MAKKTLAQRLHRTFAELNAAGDIAAIAQFLKENKIDINASLYKIAPEKQEEGGFYLFLQILEGENVLDKIDYFVKEGVDLTLRYSGKNALGRLFTRESDLPIMAKLLAVGVDPNQIDMEGNTVLITRVRAYSDSLTHNYDQEDRKVLYRPKAAIEYELEFKFIELLLQYGADPKLKNNYKTSAEDWLLHRKETGEWNDWQERLIQLFKNS